MPEREYSVADVFFHCVLVGVVTGLIVGMMHSMGGFPHRITPAVGAGCGLILMVVMKPKLKPFQWSLCYMMSALTLMVCIRGIFVLTT